jgi:hypothetical protein
LETPGMRSSERHMGPTIAKRNLSRVTSRSAPVATGPAIGNPGPAPVGDLKRKADAEHLFREVRSTSNSSWASTDGLPSSSAWASLSLVCANNTAARAEPIYREATTSPASISGPSPAEGRLDGAPLSVSRRGNPGNRQIGGISLMKGKANSV